MNNFEGGMSPIANNKESLDSKWFKRLEEIFIEDYEFLEGDSKKREEQEKSFVSGEIENPTLDYPKLDLEKLNERENQLLQLKKEILSEETNEVVKQAYRWKLNENIAMVRMLKSTFNGDDRRFGKYSDFIYGRPSEEVFVYELDDKRQKMEKFLSSKDDGRRKAAEELKELIDWDNVSQMKKPSFPEIKIEEPMEDGSVLTAEEVKVYFDDAIKSLNLEGWTTVIDENGSKSNLSANQSKKEVNIPNNEQLLKRASLIDKNNVFALIAHELGVHALRRNNGERSKLQLLGFGLDRYIRGEEGLATYKQQQVEGADEYSGGPGHFAISLAMGLDGRKRNFREVFEILKRFSILLKKESVDREERSAQIAWRQTVRVFRGTTCKARGVVYAKDMVYREGNIGIWDLINTKSDECHRFMVGKYDPTNDRHLYILDQLGISEEDLEDLK